MIKVIGVRFRTAGKVYFFDPVDFEINKGDHVIVETARGIEFGTVMNGIREVTDDEVVQPLKPVLRIATERDVKQEAENKLREKEAFRVCLEKIHEHDLDMKLIDAEYTFDNNKVLFYFTADGRIDFRELVKDLAAIFKTRIELRQIGVRDETKMKGGIGMCGRPLCCHAHLSDFIPVSIKMAKEQNLSLNPTKISGVCGRLMCCLKHEEDTYEALNRSLPNVGDRVTCPDGTQGEVASVNVLRELVKVVIEDGDSKEIHEYKSGDLKFVKKGHRQVKTEISSEELRALELLEKQDKIDSQEAEEANEKPVRKERKERGEHKERSEQENQGERKERKERKERRERRERKERQENIQVDTEAVSIQSEQSEPVNRKNRDEQNECKNRKESGEHREQGEHREHRERKERRDRRERKDSQTGIETEAQGKQIASGEQKEPGEQKLRAAEGSERRNRSNRDRNRNRDGQNGDNTRQQSTQGTHSTAESIDTSNVPEDGGKQGEGNNNKNYHKKPYYRNRRRNRPEGAKEQHES